MGENLQVQQEMKESCERVRGPMSQSRGSVQVSDVADLG